MTEVYISLYAKAKDLKIIDTVSCRCGGDDDKGRAFINFRTFDEAKEFADKTGRYPQIFTKAEGSSLWIRGEYVSDAFNMLQVYDGKPGYDVYTCGSEERFTNYVKSQIAELDDFDVIRSYIKDMSLMWSALSSICEDEFIVMKDGQFCDVDFIKKMAYVLNGITYSIGVKI